MCFGVKNRVDCFEHTIPYHTIPCHLQIFTNSKVSGEVQLRMHRTASQVIRKLLELGDETGQSQRLAFDVSIQQKHSFFEYRLKEKNTEKCGSGFGMYIVYLHI